MSQVAKRKGLARVKRIVHHKDMLVGEVFQDPAGEYNGVETLCFLNKSKQLWMLEELEEGDEVGIELPLKPGRGIDPVTWLLANHDQPEQLRQLTPSLDEKVVSVSSNNLTGEAKFSFGTAKFKGEEAEWLEQFCSKYRNKGDAFEELFRAALPLLKLLQS